ncbi:hypothetical protein ABZ929_19975 [Streptomyces physcomitrii]|uniref:hypothetical protein n=1 Tax=Streptomyces physcomitrii TaxID=2724184 RepID=UPI0034371CB2
MSPRDRSSGAAPRSPEDEAAGSVSPGPGEGRDGTVPGTPAAGAAEPLIDVLPLGVGMVLIGLGLGFLGVRVRRD